ncbi:hypothetical protein GO002_24995 [Streptomyces eurocidicus]|nr:hypothetical protein [Streptomyces eurocidicus]
MRAAGRWLASLGPADRPDLAVSSPYLRALQSWDGMAARAREQGCTPPSALVDERLRDREMGWWCGW